jgi:exosortase/archaeosortase
MKILNTFAGNTLICLIVPLAGWGVYGFFHGLEAGMAWAKANEYSPAVLFLTALTCLAVVIAIVATIRERWNDRPSVRAAKAAMAELAKRQASMAKEQQR